MQNLRMSEMFSNFAFEIDDHCISPTKRNAKFVKHIRSQLSVWLRSESPPPSLILRGYHAQE